MTELQLLEEWGLSEAEAKVYLALLETGSTLAGPIIKKTGLHRGTTYLVLQRLKEKGIVSSIIKGKKQHFAPVDPERLIDTLREREERLQDILPMLKAKLDASKEKQEITVYYGTKGIWAVIEKMIAELNPNGIYYDFGVSGLFRPLLGPYWDVWQKRKRQYKIKSQIIFNAAVIEQNPQLLKDYYGEARFHPKEYRSITDTIIYNDTVILAILTAKPPIAIVIKNKDNAESYKSHFQMMWKLATKG